jgi:hypothetical protein
MPITASGLQLDKLRKCPYRYIYNMKMLAWQTVIDRSSSTYLEIHQEDTQRHTLVAVHGMVKRMCSGMPRASAT